MNQKCSEIGLKNTHFMNATGLHNESHYTTVKDIGITFTVCIKKSNFNDIFQSKVILLRRQTSI